jgi:hypothetical protein
VPHHIDQENGPVNAVLPGRRVGPFEILSVDPNGRRAIVGCRCGSTHIFSTESLLAGAAACAVLPPTKAQREQMRAAIREQNDSKELAALRDWKPSGGRP